MIPKYLNELREIIELLLKKHTALMKEFIPAKAGLAPERAKKLYEHIIKVEEAISNIQNAQTSDELTKAINAANALFKRI